MVNKNNRPKCCSWCVHSEDEPGVYNFCTLINKNVRHFWICDEFIHIFDEEAKHCMNQESDFFESVVTYGDCYQCKFFDECWDVD